MLDHLHRSISFLLIQIARSHRSCAQDGLSEFGLHAGQEMFLIQLMDQDGQTQSQLAERLGIQLPTVHKMIARLESGGIVERRADLQDTRISRVYLTEQGRGLLTNIRQMWDDLESRTTANLTLDERILLRRLLMQVYDNLNQPD